MSIAVKIKLVGSACGNGVQHQFLMSYQVNDTIALDAGCIGLITPVAEQRRIEHVFLSHSHIDHLASLPIFIDNVFTPGPQCPKIYCTAEVQAVLRQDMFNDRLWPDVIRLSAAESAFLEFRTIAPGDVVEADGLRISLVPLNHVVPTLGFILEDPQTGDAAAIISDTGPTNEIWDRLAELAQLDRLKLVFLEASFPNRMQWLADKSLHLTPRTFAEQSARLPASVRLVAVHLKPDFHAQIAAELAALGRPQLEIGKANQIYETQ